MSREWWLVVHLLGVVLFLGNIVVTALWKSLADRTREPAVIAFAQRLLTVTDIAFTAVGGGLVLVSGLVLADDVGGVGGPGWLTAGFLFFLASVAIWLVVLVPVQAAQWRLARSFRNGDSIPDRFWQLARIWAIFGTVATLLPFVNLYLMIVKPG